MSKAGEEMTGIETQQKTSMAEMSMDAVSGGMSRYQYLPPALKIIVVVMASFAVAMFLFYNFGWSIGGWILQSVQYYYLLYATLFSCVFIMLPFRKNEKHRKHVQWYDLALAGIVFGIFMYFSANSYDITFYGWVPPPHTYDIALASIIGILALEGSRRLIGWPFVILCIVGGTYPLYSSKLPGMLFGPSFDFTHIMTSFAFGKQGLLGLPAQMVGDIVIGFLLFAGILLASGAGAFFLNLALGLLGRVRGGPAKVAVLASASFGMLQGGGAVNILTTGSITIPAMKRLGYPSHYAAAIEAVASNGGAIMPPVASIAFIMAVLSGYPYAVIMAACTIPAILYYWGLLVQVDAYAGRKGLIGLSKEEIPPLWETLKSGWQYIVVLIFMVVGFMYFRWGVITAIYSAGLLFVLSYVNPKTMMTPKRIFTTLSTIASLSIYMIAMLTCVGFIMIGLTVTGSLTALTAQIVALGGENVLLILLVTVLVCYLFGMVGIAMLPYIVMAVTVIPVLVTTTGMSEVGLHLFLMFYLMMAAITPPVAIASFIAAAFAGAPPMKTAFTSMRLAVVLYFIPFFFLYHPALIFQGPAIETAYLLILCLVGIWLLASGLEGYLMGIGNIRWWARPVLVIGGFMIAFPMWLPTVIGAILSGAVIAVLFMSRKASGKRLTTGDL